ncbi:hypothetical protein [Streptomyces sp. NPDC087512]
MQNAPELTAQRMHTDGTPTTRRPIARFIAQLSPDNEELLRQLLGADAQ